MGLINIMSRLGSGMGLVKALPFTAERPTIIKGLISLNLAFYGIYNLSSGPARTRMRNYMTLQPESGPQALLMMHTSHTSLLPMLFNCGVLATLGASHITHMGCSHFSLIFGASCAAGALFAGMDMRNNPN